ncbi:MAG: hypothetical protein JWN65_962 [Solirubrobacterales bacterium]|nr:hypothetical protein [Solirubrobacterales bacterium]
MNLRPPGSQQLGQCASIQPIGLRARLPDPGVGRRDDDHPRDMPLENPRDLPRVDGHLKRHEVARREALREQLQRVGARAATRPADLTLPASTIATLQKSRCTSKPTALTDTSSPSDDLAGEPVGNDIDGSALAAQPGKSQGAATEKPGLQLAHRPNRPAHPAFSQRAPRPSPANLSRRPDATFNAQFHVPTSGSVTGRIAARRPPAGIGCSSSQSTIFQKESLRLILPSVNSNRSHPRTSMDSPVALVPRIVHSDTPRSPHVQWRASP